MRSLTFLLLFWSFNSFGYAHVIEELNSIDDVSQTDIYLVSMGRSDELYTTGGHSVLRVVNKNSNIDLVFNWGTFDPDEDYFIYKFYKGVLPYSFSSSRSNSYFAFELHINPRDTFQDLLVLTPSQKKILINRLKWWALPENNQYQYHIWDHNCATVIRDIINEALGGKLKEVTGKRSTNKTYRDYWHETFGKWEIIGTGSDLLLNYEADDTVDEYEVMFIPMEMRRVLLNTPSFPETNSTNLLEAKPQIFERKKPLPDLVVSGFIALAVIFLAPLVLYWLSKWQFLLGLSFFLWGGFSFFSSTIVLLTSWFTNRTYFYYTGHLQILWPLDFIFIITGFLMMIKKGSKNSSLLFRIKHKLCLLHIPFHITYLILASLKVPTENLVNIAWSCGLPSLMLIATYVYKTKKESSYE